MGVPPNFLRCHFPVLFSSTIVTQSCLIMLFLANVAVSSLTAPFFKALQTTEADGLFDQMREKKTELLVLALLSSLCTEIMD